MYNIYYVNNLLSINIERYEMNKLVTILCIGALSMLFSQYSVGETVRESDNISWTDNYGYSSDIFTEVAKGKPVMIFFKLEFSNQPRTVER